MQKGLAVVVLIVALTLAGAAWGASTKSTTHEPPWVIDAAADLAFGFPGHPKPLSVTYVAGRPGTVVITELFSHDVVCNKCHWAPGGISPRGTRARITLDTHTHQAVAFGIYRR